METEQRERHEDGLDRRTFLKGLIVVLNLLLAVALAIPGVGYILTPVLRKTEHTWKKVGRVGDYAPGAFTKAIFGYVSASGYVRAEKSAFVWLRHEETGAFTAFSPKCTHMGCNVSWNRQAHRFECPCHGGMYDEEGRVIAGPPPKPLQRFQTRVENDIIYLYWQEA